MNGPVPEDFCPRVSPGLIQAEVEDGLAIYDPRSTEVLFLNHSAQAVWSCCDGTGSVAEIAADIAEVCKADAPSVLLEVRTLVADWHQRGLVGPGPL